MYARACLSYFFYFYFILLTAAASSLKSLKSGRPKWRRVYKWEKAREEWTEAGGGEETSECVKNWGPSAPRSTASEHARRRSLFFLPFLIMRASSFLMLIANRLIKAKLKATPWVLLCCRKNTSWLPWCFFFFNFFLVCVCVFRFSPPFFYTPVVPNIHSYIHSHTCAHAQLPTLSALFPWTLLLGAWRIFTYAYMSESGARRGWWTTGVCVYVYGEGATMVVGRRWRKKGSRTNRRRWCAKTKNLRRWQGWVGKTTSSALRTIDFCIF